MKMDAVIPDKKIVVVVPNWNGSKFIETCFRALGQQSAPHHLVVVDNGSTDGSVDLIETKHSEITLIKNRFNTGFANAANQGIRFAQQQNAKYVVLINNDVTPEPDWLKHLESFLDNEASVGIVTSKILTGDGKRIDSTGELYSFWGLAFPRGRGEPTSDKYDRQTPIFGASGGASLYRLEMLNKIGVFDKNFFAYYEDVDLSFRAQLAGWRVGYEPKAVVRHQIGATSGKIKGFTTYHTIKNLPWLFWKNVPSELLLRALPRFFLAYLTICLSALSRGQIKPVAKGLLVTTALLPKKLGQRYKIQSSKKVSSKYISSIMTHDLPPGARKLRSLRATWWKLTGRSNV